MFSSDRSRDVHAFFISWLRFLQNQSPSPPRSLFSRPHNSSSVSLPQNNLTFPTQPNPLPLSRMPLTQMNGKLVMSSPPQSLCQEKGLERCGREIHRSMKAHEQARNPPRRPSPPIRLWSRDL